MTEKAKTKRRRTCRDRRRYERYQRRRRGGNPAAALAAQFLALIALLAARMPLPWPAPSPRPLGRRPQRRASRPRRTDWSPEQEARERGEGGALPPLSRQSSGSGGAGRYRSRPSYRRLAADLRRPAARAEAADVLRRRLPPEALPWLDDVLARDDWTALASCAQRGMLDGRAEEAMLRAALAWAEAKTPPEAAPEAEQGRPVAKL
jgi:hypothetical protein